MKLKWLLFQLPAIVLILGGAALAQNVGDNTVYFVTYFSNGNTSSAPDQTIRIVNDGDTAAPLWASFYVFDDSEEMEECCSCEVTPDGLLSESVNKQLTASTFSARSEVSRGVVKIISSSVPAVESTNYTNTLAPGLRVWATHTQAKKNGSGGFAVTETDAADSNLGTTEKSNLEILCGWVNYLGSGWGVCSCTPEDQDF
jgi:hypothetical protein